MKNLTSLVVLICLGACQLKSGQVEIGQEEKNASTKPNILWLVTEDMSAYIPAFGDSTIVTPNLSRLAAEGIRYPNLYSTSGVCSPSRAAIATGMYPSGIGANHMRTSSYTDVTGLKKYEAVPPPAVKMVSELLRGNGYYCSNNYKEDYQFRAPETAWDESSPYAHWRNRDKDQPFFSVFNFTVTHESALFEPYGHRIIETRYDHLGDRNYKSEDGRAMHELGPRDLMTEEETNKHIPKDLDFPIPPYLPNTEVVRRDMWKMYNNIAEMDRQLGLVLKQLEEDGLLDNTIIFFYGDHGGPLPRQKRLIYESGLKTPLIIRFPNSKEAGSLDDQLISFIDFAPTLLSLTGAEKPDHMQGQAFLGQKKSDVEREFIHAAADRFDGFTDVIRAVKADQFRYIRNYRTDQGYYLPVAYREKIPTMQELLRLREEGGLTEVQAQWFREAKPRNELFDCKNDPHELNNLADDPAYKEILEKLSSEMDRWLVEIGDNPDLAEKELITKLWNGAESKPVTAGAEVKFTNSKATISCKMAGASIGYKIVPISGKEPKAWSVYQEPVQVTDGSVLKVMTHRIGYVPSKVKSIKVGA
ncbi:MAG: sulfatase-like hydrolase/transferase [Cyclobacteriaceae bacterium]